MIINTKEIQQLLDDAKHTGYNIEKKVGVTRGAIAFLRQGKSSLLNSSLETVWRLQHYYNVNFRDQKPAAYDYDELLKKTKVDQIMGEIQEFAYIKRKPEPLAETLYYPVISIENKSGRDTEKIKTNLLIEEMELWNKKDKK